MTPNDKSLIKARYFESILRVAKPIDQGSALRMIKSLETEATTDGAADEVVQAEDTAIEAVRELSVGLRRRTSADAAWNKAAQAVTRWINLLT